MHRPPATVPPRPPVAERLFQQALAWHRQRELARAEQDYRAALQRDSRHFGALVNLGLIMLDRNQSEAALKLIRRALYLKPNAPDAAFAMGLVLARVGQHGAAIGQFHKTLAVWPEHAPAHNGLGLSLRALNRHAEALAEFEQVVALRPTDALAHSNLGISLRTMGRLAEGMQALEQAVALSPRTPGHYRVLGESKRYTPGDPRLAALEALAADTAALGEDDRIDLHFALGKAYADLGQQEQSFRQLLAGNAAKRRLVRYDEPAILGLLAQTKALLTAEVIAERSGLGDPSPQPIFIVGMPRSGSTLIEQILASHPDVYGGGEMNDFTVAVTVLSRNPRDTAPDIGAKELRAIGADYLARTRARVPVAADRIADKMLGNARLVGLIHLALPDARIIYARRNPLDTCLSCFSTLFGEGQLYSYDLGELGRFARAHDDIMQHWQAVLPPGVMLDVQYEDVVADLETQARRIIAHCGLQWTDACLEFHKTDRPVHTASVVQVRQPIYRSSVGRWKPYKALLQPLFVGLAIEPPAN